MALSGGAPAGPDSASWDPETSGSDLSSILVPAPDAPWWPVISEFALTYNAYDRANGFDGVAEAANQASVA